MADCVKGSELLRGQWETPLHSRWSDRGCHSPQLWEAQEKVFQVLCLLSTYLVPGIHPQVSPSPVGGPNANTFLSLGNALMIYAKKVKGTLRRRFLIPLRVGVGYK